MRCSSALASIAVMAGLVAAHAGGDHHKEQAIRRDYLQHTKNSLSHCSAKIKARGLEARNIKRREQLAREAAEKRGISLLNCMCGPIALADTREERSFAGIPY